MELNICLFCFTILATLQIQQNISYLECHIPVTMRLVQQARWMVWYCQQSNVCRRYFLFTRRLNEISSNVLASLNAWNCPRANWTCRITCWVSWSEEVSTGISQNSPASPARNIQELMFMFCFWRGRTGQVSWPTLALRLLSPATLGQQAGSWLGGSWLTCNKQTCFLFFIKITKHGKNTIKIFTV